VKYAQGLGPERLVVVILPDSGTRYLSKIFDDDWMREHGFLELDRRRATALQVAQARGLPTLVTARPGDRVSAVVARMRADAVSQLPVVDDAGELQGLVTEVDLLRHLLTGGPEAAEQPIGQLASRDVRAVPTDTPFEEMLPDLTSAKVVVLVDEAGRPRGILTMIDAVEFLAAAPPE
jgi:cystathionine beta-synthase